MKLIIKNSICATFILIQFHMVSAHNTEVKHIFELSDGRNLSYCEYGLIDGNPVFYFHGFPGSRLDVKFFGGDEAARKNNIRLISVDRPGYGSSDIQPGRSLLEWPKDIIELADKLGIDKFSILAYSGGGPYALACANSIPERIDKLIIVSGMTHFKAPMAKEGTAMLIPKMPGLFQNVILKGMNKMITKNPDKILENLYRSMPDVDKEIMQNIQFTEAFLNTLRESFRTGHKGAKQEARIYKKEWGFDLSDISHKIYLFHGEQDLNVKNESVKYIVQQLHDCEIIFYPQEGHMSLINNRIDEILNVYTK